jgi:hypothetical protein
MELTITPLDAKQGYRVQVLLRMAEVDQHGGAIISPYDTLYAEGTLLNDHMPNEQARNNAVLGLTSLLVNTLLQDWRLGLRRTIGRVITEALEAAPTPPGGTTSAGTATPIAEGVLPPIDWMASICGECLPEGPEEVHEHDWIQTDGSGHTKICLCGAAMNRDGLLLPPPD